MIWREARPDNDYARVLPYLEEVLNLSRQAAAAKAAALGCSAYEALLDQYEAGGRTDRIDAMFDDLATFLPDFLETALSKQAARGEAVMPAGPFDTDRQRDLGRRLMGVLGFDFDAGRLDVSLHPFCGGVPGDIRITTRLYRGRFHAEPDGRAARNRPRALRNGVAGRLALSAGWIGAWHGAA